MSEDSRGEWTSASSAQADRLCRGRHQAQIGLPELPPSEAAESGTVIHALWTGKAPPRPPTAEETDKAQALRDQEKVAVQEFFGPGDGLVRFVERRVWHEFPAPGPGQEPLKTSGQFDVALVQPASRRALILDGKSGWLPVTPNPSNLQLRRLAALLWLNIEPEEIGVCILRPGAAPEIPCVYTPPDLQRSVGEMEEDVRQSQATDAPRMAGEHQCRFCRGRESCPTRLAWLSAVLPVSLSPVPLVSARDWTPGQRALFLERQKDARDWLDARKEEIKGMLAEDPDAVPGFRLRPGRMLETIKNPQEVSRRFCQVVGGTLEAFLACARIGKGELKEQVRALTGHQGKALEKAVDALLEGCVESRASAPTIERVK